jgi:hypothetical protein
MFSDPSKRHLCGECASFQTPRCEVSIPNSVEHIEVNTLNQLILAICASYEMTSIPGKMVRKPISKSDFACRRFFPSWRREFREQRKSRREFLQKVENL